MCVSKISGWSVTIRHNIASLSSLFSRSPVVGRASIFSRLLVLFDAVGSCVFLRSKFQEKKGQKIRVFLFPRERLHSPARVLSAPSEGDLKTRCSGRRVSEERKTLPLLLLRLPKSQRNGSRVKVSVPLSDAAFCDLATKRKLLPEKKKAVVDAGSER